MKKQLPALTSLRFFAAAMIVVQHAAGHFGVFKDLAKNYALDQGVSFFFVLSGFILTYTHGNLSGVKNSIYFLWARIARIWPSHATTMITFYILWAYVFSTGYSPDISTTLSNLTLTQSWIPYPSYFFSYNGVSWSLSTELFFYAMFPLLIINIRKNWPLKLLFSVSLLGLSFLIISITRPPAVITGDIITSASWLYIWPPARLLEFVFGMLAGLVVMQKSDSLLDSRWSAIYGFMALTIMICAGILVPNLSSWMLSHQWISLPLAGWLNASGAAPFFALGILLLAVSKDFITRALSFKPLVWLGEISFSIYLTHQIIQKTLSLHPQWFASIDQSVQMPGYCIFVIIVSFLLWRFIEKPAQKLMLSPFKNNTKTLVNALQAKSPPPTTSSPHYSARVNPACESTAPP